eukprot:1582834-Karenia_brevis.AAC.1
MSNGCASSDWQGTQPAARMADGHSKHSFGSLEMDRGLVDIPLHDGWMTSSNSAKRRMERTGWTLFKIGENGQSG